MMLMALKKDRIIFHLDCNSAFLSWSAVNMLSHGNRVDLRDIPSAVGGNEHTRHGIILAKSTPAKKYNIQTGEPIFQARMKCSNAMLEILKEYTPVIQKYSIDECFLDFTNMGNLYPNTYDLAFTIKERIKKDLGFTVSIGISNNKLLAKMGSDLRKPDAITELYPSMIKEKIYGRW